MGPCEICLPTGIKLTHKYIFKIYSCNGLRVKVNSSIKHIDHQPHWELNLLMRGLDTTVCFLYMCLKTALFQYLYNFFEFISVQRM